MFTEKEQSTVDFHRESYSNCFRIERFPTQSPKGIAKTALSQMAPLWTLKRFVSVNPFLGKTGQDFAEVANELRMTTGARLYNNQTDDLQSHGSVKNNQESGGAIFRLPSQIMGTASCAFENVNDNFGKWFSTIIDTSNEGGRTVLGLQTSPSDYFARWREFARNDLSLDIMGLKSVRQEISRLSDNYEDTLASFLGILQVSDACSVKTFEAIAHANLGWIGYGLFMDRESNSGSSIAIQMLAARVAYELAILKAKLISLPVFKAEIKEKLILSDAHDACQDYDLRQKGIEKTLRRQISKEIQASIQNHKIDTDEREIQILFCIDGRSEPIRRCLEMESIGIETKGFAGFYGITMSHESDDEELTARCPVLLKPTCRYDLNQRRDQRFSSEKIKAYAKNSPGTMFSYVEAFGLIYGAQLLRKSFKKNKPNANRQIAKGRLSAMTSDTLAEIALETKIEIAQGILKNSGLKGSMAKIIVLTGHGSRTMNNAYGSALDCGACGGHSGEVNAVAACDILNDKAVQSAVRGTAYTIPDGTIFIPAFHNTTTNQVELLLVADQKKDEQLFNLQKQLNNAAAAANHERWNQENRRGGIKDASLEARIRSHDFSEIRPEWGLARNALFIAGRRQLTSSVNLKGRAFLHDYDARQDDDGSILELILTAPLVVAHWINMQYYASTVDPLMFGAGSKTLHNLVGSFGALEGNGYQLKVGLPLESVFYGTEMIHEPLRLQVFVEAACQDIDGVLGRHLEIRQLVENHWLTLSSIDPNDASIRVCRRMGDWVEEEKGEEEKGEEEKKKE
ncbi:MAG: putative inorganic carbon transporter subunit DabA [Pseudomonadota bacterium]